jgi:hypothetical protein
VVVLAGARASSIVGLDDVAVRGRVVDLEVEGAWGEALDRVEGVGGDHVGEVVAVKAPSRFRKLTLEKTVIAASDLQLKSLSFLGEPGFKMTRLVYHPVLGRGLSAFRWVWPRIAHRWCREIGESQVSSAAENIAVVVLRKPT